VPLPVSENDPLERKTHPSYDRVTGRRILIGVGIAVPSLLGLLAKPVAGEWVVWPAIAGFLIGVGVVVSTPVNRSTCPTCGERLSRPRNSTEFPCSQCDVVWVTQSFGESAFERRQ
jgi:hypothetical protein